MLKQTPLGLIGFCCAEWCVWPAEALALPGFVSWNILEAEGEAKTQSADGRKR